MLNFCTWREIFNQGKTNPFLISEEKIVKCALNEVDYREEDDNFH